MTRIRFLARARTDLRNARQRYSEENPVAARRFMEAVVDALRLIREAPERWALFDDQRRRFVLASFPYSVIYRCFSNQGEVRVIAIAHHRRRPGYWSRK